MPEQIASRAASARRVLMPPVFALAGTAVALWPYPTVIQQLDWVPPIVLLAVALVLVGVLTRAALAKLRATTAVLCALGVQLVVLACALTAMFAPESTFWGVLPSWDTLQAVPELFWRASIDIWYGNSPLVPTSPVIFIVTAALGTLAIVLDQLLAHGRVVIAALAIAAVGGGPLIAAGTSVEAGWFAAYGVLVLLLLRHSLARDARAPRRSPLWLTALVGTTAIAVTVFISPSFPLPGLVFGANQQVTLNPTLNLGEDLRRPDSVDVISLATTASAPYLRIATLTELRGEVWRADTFARRPLGQALSREELSDDAPLQTTSLRIQNVDGRSLPVPYPALGAQGMTGDWFASAENRTIISGGGTSRDQDYTVISLRLTPTLEQMQADRAGGSLDPANWELPGDIPESVARLAREVTAEAETDADRLLALQAWFRSQFSYSLNTPVEEGFDGSGAQAVGVFLEVREGYCVHFAAAFTLMARSLGMPARIVVGFLPGTPTGQYRGEETLYRVTSDQLHAWPEVHFEEWGWLSFEPTASLGTPTRLPTEEEQQSGQQETPPNEPGRTPDRTDAPDDGLAPPDSTLNPDGTPATPTAINPLPFLLGFAAVLLVLATPAILRSVRRGTRMRRAARGDAVAAWTELEDTLADLRIPIPDAESLRARAERLVRDHGAAVLALHTLVDAAEEASYAAAPGEPRDLATPLRRVLRALRAQAGSGRVAARLLPRSLVPGPFPPTTQE